jgi:hypothetical protein
MRLSIKLAFLSLVLITAVGTAVAASKSPKLSRCDGKNRRPANVYGSVLPTVDPVSGAVTPTDATQDNVEIFPQPAPAKPNARGSKARPDDKPPPQVPPISAITPPTSYGRC